MNNNGVGGDPSERNRKENMKTIQDYPFFADIPVKTYHEEARAGKYLSSPATCLATSGIVRDSTDRR